MRCWRSLLLPALLSFLPVKGAHAGAWTQPEGQGQYIQNIVFYSTGEAFDGAGHRAQDAGFRKLELNPYLEYGVTDRWTVGLSAFLHYLEQDAAAGGVAANIGLGETEVFARYRLYEHQGFVLSAQPLLKLPSHYRDRAPVAGRTQWDGEAALFGGYGFSAMGQHHYLDTKLAWRARSGALHDQFRASLAFGMGITDSLQLLPELYWTGRAQGGNAAFSVSGQNDYELLKGQLSLVWHLDERYAVQFGAFRHIAGEDTGAGGGVFTAFWTRW